MHVVHVFLTAAGSTAGRQGLRMGPQLRGQGQINHTQVRGEGPPTVKLRCLASVAGTGRRAMSYREGEGRCKDCGVRRRPLTLALDEVDKSAEGWRSGGVQGAGQERNSGTTDQSAEQRLRGYKRRDF